jgi:hypothetical protein
MLRRAILSLLLFVAISIDGRVARQAQANDTLRQALAPKHLPTDAAKLANFDKSITSWAELDDANQYLIAYYLDDGTNELNPPLFIDRYDRKRAEWKSVSFPDAHTNSAQPDDNCYGSVLRVGTLGSRFFLDTHINPSAGCLLVFSPDLKLEAGLYGWLERMLGEDTLIYQRSQIHFAPVHPAEIALYDLRTKRDVTLFPRKPDSAIRRARTAQLAEFYKTNKQWCKENDDPCDPENFDSALQEEVATNEAEAAVAFLISYEQIQLVAGDVQKPSGPKDVLYVYHRVDDEAKMEYREMLLADAKARFGIAKLQGFVQAEILQKIFAEAAAK